MKIYTKTGDKGKTSLLGGKRVDKDHFRIEAYGTVDELNSFVGLLITKLPEKHEATVLLKRIQGVLFSVGSILACPPDSKFRPELFAEVEIELLEKTVDRYQSNLEPLKNFILPGGHELAAMAHICRSVCRRAERRIISFRNFEAVVDERILQYLNRLSDYFFVLSRKLNAEMQSPEIIWSGR